MDKPLEIKALDIYLSMADERINALKLKVDEPPVDVVDAPEVCPNCEEKIEECKCGGAPDGEALEKKYAQAERQFYSLFGDVDTKGTRFNPQTKVRYVRESAYWGVPAGTPITPGMKPEGPASPAGRDRAVAVTRSAVVRSLSARANPTVADPEVPTAPRKPVRRGTGSASSRDRARDIADRDAATQERQKRTRRRASASAQEQEQQAAAVAAEEAAKAKINEVDSLAVRRAANAANNVPVNDVEKPSEKPADSLLPKKYQNSHPSAQVQSLARIASRAEAHADWLKELLDRDDDPEDPAYTPDERDRMSAEIEQSREKADRAIDEATEIADSSGDLDLKRKAKQARAIRAGETVVPEEKPKPKRELRNAANLAKYRANQPQRRGKKK
jgi:hypothetical protein